MKDSSLLKKIFALSIIWQLILFWRLPRFIWENGLVQQWFYSKGLMFYKDFAVVQYFPLPNILMIPINKVFNFNIWITNIVGLSVVLLALYLIYYFSRNYLPKKTQILPLIYFSIWQGFILKQNTFEINLYLGVILLASVILQKKYLEKPSKLYTFLLGFILSLGVFSQQVMILPTAIFFLALFISAIVSRKPYGEILRRFIIPFCIGFSIPAFTLLIFLLRNNIFYQFWDSSVLYYMRGDYPISEHSHSPQDILLLIVLLIPFYWYSIMPLKKTKPNEDIVKITTIIVFLSMLVFTWEAVFHPRRFLIFLPLVSIFSGYIIDMLNTKTAKILLGISFVIFLYYAGTNIAPWYINAIKKGTIHDFETTQHPDDDLYYAKEWVIEKTDESDTLFSFAPMIIYYETNRLPAINKTYILPWAFEPFDNMKLQLMETPADYWLVDERMFTRFSQLNYDYQSKYLRSYLDNNYEKVFEHGWSGVYKLKAELE